MLLPLLYLSFVLPGHALGQMKIDNSETISSNVCQVKSGDSKLPSNKPATTAEQVACQKFTQAFYTWYLSHGKSSDPLHLALKQKKANFSPELLRSLNEDAAAAKKSPGEIVGLDFDPVLNSQDFAEKYVAGKVSQKGSIFSIDVYAIENGKKMASPLVVPELRHTGGQWVFINFRYNAEGKKDDLLSLLKRLKAARK